MSEPPREPLPKEMLAKLEAALYAAGRPLTIEEVMHVTGTTSERRATALARELARTVNSALQAVELVEYSGPRFAMQLKAQFTSTARKFATRPLLSRASLRSLSFIAFFQPISSAELVLRRGSAVYDHLKDLEEVGFVASERQGRSKFYRTTGRFAEYFGLSTDLTTMKRQLETRTLALR